MPFLSGLRTAIRNGAERGFPMLREGARRLLGVAENSTQSGPDIMPNAPPIIANYTKLYAALVPVLGTVLTDGWIQVICGILVLVSFWRTPQRTGGGNGS